MAGGHLEQWALEDAAERIEGGPSFEAEVDGVLSGSLDEVLQPLLTISPARWTLGQCAVLAELAQSDHGGRVLTEDPPF